MGFPIKTKKQINEEQADKIAEAISTPEGRIALYVNTWFPFDRYKIYGETEQQRVNRLYSVLQREAQEIEDELSK